MVKGPIYNLRALKVKKQNERIFAYQDPVMQFEQSTKLEKMQACDKIFDSIVEYKLYLKSLKK